MHQLSNSLVSDQERLVLEEPLVLIQDHDIDEIEDLQIFVDPYQFVLQSH